MLKNKLHVSVARFTEAQNDKKKKKKEEENSGLSFKTKAQFKRRISHVPNLIAILVD